MFKKKFIIFALLITFLALSSSCRRKPLNTNLRRLNICFCVDSLGLNEPVFNKKVYSALSEINLRSEFNIIIRRGELKENYLKNLKEFAVASDILICGYLMNDEILKVSLEFPRKYFILLDGIASDDKDMPVYRDNIVSCVFDESEKAFLAGEVTGIFLKKDEKAGIICVGDKLKSHSRFVVDSFRKGIEEHNSSVEIKYRFIKDPNDSAIALSLFNELSQEKCKIVYLCNGGYITSIFDSIESKYPLIISEEIGTATGGKNLLGTVDKNYKVVLETIIKDIVEKKLKGGINVFGLRDGAIIFRANETILDSEALEKLRDGLR